MMTVVRTLSLLKPFLRVTRSLIMILAGLFFLFEIIIVSLAFSETIHYKYYWLELAVLPTTLTTLIIISCVVSICCLLVSGGGDVNTSGKRRRNVHASTTVLILAMIFCLFNIPFCVVHIWEYALGPGSLYGSVHNYDTYVFVYSLCIPLNSAINPVVYFARNEKLRIFIINKLFCGRDINNLGTTFWRSESSKAPSRPVPAVVVYRNQAPQPGGAVRLKEVLSVPKPAST